VQYIFVDELDTYDNDDEHLSYTDTGDEQIEQAIADTESVISIPSEKYI